MKRLWRLKIVSGKDVEALNLDLENQENDYLYDIIYCDCDRLSVFQAQRTELGHLTGQVRNQGSGSNLTLEGEAKGTLLAASAKGKSTSNEAETNSLQQTYDPKWSEVLSLLDYVAPKSIQSDFLDTKLGSFTLVKSSLSVMELEEISTIFQLDIVKNNFKKALKQHQNQDARISKIDGNQLHDIVMEVMKRHSNAVQIFQKLDSDSFWMTAKKDNFCIEMSEFVLKFGNRLPGDWMVLGVMDAKPNYESEWEEPELNGQFRKVATSWIPVIQKMLGRPENCFAITPLVIFREIG